MALALVIAALYVWSSHDAAVKQQDEALKKEIAEKQRKADREYALIQKRWEQATLIADASDEKLRSLYNECERKISEAISKERKPAFAVYFPNYDVADLDRLSTIATAMNISSGRPSLVLENESFESKRIERLRKFHSMSIVAESASDSFSGPKKWAAEYECDLDGLSIKSVRQVGRRFFFD
jgi:hypothetical protein